ncbi:MAG: hypothetical protein GTO45_08425 [Candidatus Aminicenantes bacterium]|nr:hypothetical protein [Candidatus Aminicenantes bacterium]NIM78856.1 hypothetical protein [Candidatus Aminicenantes bacterium]NIN18112.1 hypothetical protein [Candidatus Aminicenantes bacterium]NIN42011.1 hypothetical protein [Candidatus Aminicenantes bacterium]NIN84767.1 hypothetical protein [Candidatus Aminicenantes bacterium]
MKHVFVLGCERSGTTWLSNIFDSHPDVEFFMEPFADYAAIFEKIPGRNIYSDHPGEELTNEVKNGYNKLYSLKYPLFYKSGRPLYLKKLDKFIIESYQRIKRRFKSPVSLKIQRYDLLHLNTRNIPPDRQSRKSANPSFTVTKELRLNFKIGLISGAFPGAGILVCIRHPGAQAASIMKLFSRGSLGELHRSLLTFMDDIKNCPRFEKYRDLINHSDWENDPEIKLVLWWLINYDVMLEDLYRFQCTFRLVSHEEISEDPDKVVNRVFDFIGLDFVGEVRSYLDLSSKSNGDIQSNVDTRRDSANYYKKMIKAVNPVLNDKIRQVILHYSETLNPLLRSYLETCYDL